jgi:DNA mismatch endonuclease (patch repair protein)
LPKSNRRYWMWKFNSNKERDARKREELLRQGWKVFVFWECQVNKCAYKCAKRVNDYMDKRGHNK